MRILLPPSEGKAGGGSGSSLREAGFAPTGIGRHRERLSRAVARTAAGRVSTASVAFGLPPTVVNSALAANRAVLDSPTMPALERYRGVVYDGLDVATLSPAQRSVADDSVVVFSGLWGALGAGEPVPDYRVPATATLPRIGMVGRSWRAVLARSLPAVLGDDVIVDLRSSDYAAMWTPPATADIVRVRVLSARPDGRLGVLSFPGKLGKGRLTRALVARVAAGGSVGTAADVAAAWLDAGLGTIGPTEETGAGGGRVDLVTAGATA